MKVLLALVVLISFDNLLNSVKGTAAKHYSDQVLSVTPRTQEQADILKNITSQHEIVLWQPVSPQYIRPEGTVHMFVPANSSETVTDLLRRHHLTYELLLDNTEELIELQTRNDSSDPRSMLSFYERYHGLEDIYHWINRTAQENPERVKVLLIGSSYEKRPLFVLKLSGQETLNKRAMWIDCGIHAREWIAPAFCLWFVHYSLVSYKHNSEISQMLDNMDIYVLPVMNPDGYKFTWTPRNRMWRKNRSQRKNSSCFGADLNRNFDANWCTEGASNQPCDDTYCGQFPESEPEAKAVANFLRSHKDSVKLYLSIHSYSQMMLFPYSYTYDQVPNHDELLEMVQEAAMKVKRYYRNSYTVGAGASTIYLAPGGSDDWAYNQGIRYSFTFELQDRGRYGFLLPTSMISKACNEALIAVKTIAIRVIEKTQILL